MKKNQVVIRDIYDICDALNDLNHDIGVNKSRIDRLESRISFHNAMGAGLLCIGAYMATKAIQRLIAKVNATNPKRVQEMQDQLDIQEEKILQLELELEDLKKG